ncbi:MAG: TetR/AcrR family transcriptional regulator [Lachnospiraceae bacterium]|nr:TetR/AcrR family transcriptional regulator [Lachnospiraceae bacterium]
MSDKAARKRQYIIDTAKTVFADKGFKSVTMKDIVEACDISRGGLYIYFDSTESIFNEIISEAAKQSIESVTGKTAGDKLAFFLNEQKKEILSKDKSLATALYEYLFYMQSIGNSDNAAADAFHMGLDTIEAIIREGVESGEFYADDVHTIALNIMYLMEGLKIAARTTGVSEKDIDSQLIFILGSLIAEE